MSENYMSVHVCDMCVIGLLLFALVVQKSFLSPIKNKIKMTLLSNHLRLFYSPLQTLNYTVLYQNTPYGFL